MFEKKKTILFAIGSLAVGGAETQMVMLAEALAARGWTVRVFSLGGTGPLQARLDEANITVIDGKYPSRATHKVSAAIGLMRSAALLLLEITRRRPSVLHAFLPLANFLSAVIGRLAVLPRIITSKRALGFHQDRAPIFRRLDRIANRLSHLITANAPEVARDTEKRDGYPAQRIIVVPNGLDCGRFTVARSMREATRRSLGLREGEIAIIKVANLIPYKGHAELIDACLVLMNEGLSIRLFLAGDDRGIGALLQAKVEESDLTDRIHFMGHQKEIATLLCAMDIGVMASHEEGLSNALIEKAAAGLSIVATDVGGNNQVLRGLPNCALVPPRSSTEMAAALRNAITSMHGRADNNVALRQQITRDRYSVEAMVNEYERLYEAS